MLDAGGGGGGYGGTNWNGYDVRQMWSHAGGSADRSALEAGVRLAQDLRADVDAPFPAEGYREKLAEAWPPERSAASAAYVAHLDYLIGHVQQTYDAAVANYDAFAGATGALSTTRYELKKIYDEYQANQVKLDDYALIIAAATDPANSGLPQPAPGPPPVPTGRQEQLNGPGAVADVRAERRVDAGAGGDPATTAVQASTPTADRLTRIRYGGGTAARAIRSPATRR